MIRKCVICGTDFKCYPSDKKITCSKACSIEQKRRSHNGKRNKWNHESKQKKSAAGMTENLLKGTPAAMRSPRSGSFETNVNAKEWILVDPDEKEHHIRNLSLWCKRNAAEIFGREPHQVRSGFMQIKRSMQGKRRDRPAMHYMDWALKDTWSHKDD